jgi:acetyl esterase/lipase
MKLSPLPARFLSGAAFSLALISALSVSTRAADAPMTAPVAAKPAPAAPRGPVILLWPNGAPGSEGKTAPEKIDERGYVSSVHQPSLTVYLPAAGKATGAAVLVIPGGGHRILAIDHEGYNVAAWLSERGIAAFVLKHRLAREEGSTYKIEVESLQDTERAMRLIRSRATEWGIDSARVGVMGFSAGGELAAMIGIRSGPGAADAADPVDRLDAKPAFQALIYPGRSGTIVPDKDSAPAFLACGYKDRTDISEGLAEVYLRFKRAGVPAELHIFSESGHGFGLRPTLAPPTGDWPMRLTEWMNARGFLKRT